MKYLSISCICLLLSAVPGFILAQDPDPPVQEPQEQEPQPAQEQPPAPEPLPRVIGQARSQAEYDAWMVVENAADLGEKALLAERFLETYPDSGLTPYAHMYIALDNYQAGDTESFVVHAEKAVDEIPDAAELLGRLAFAYAEGLGQSRKAIDRGEKALAALEKLEKQPGVPAEDWVAQRDQLRADAFYAIGRAYLNLFTSAATNPETRAEHPHLLKAIDYFQKAVEVDPGNDYAYFRLGFAHLNANNIDQALKAYAHAVAVGGIAAQPSEAKIEEVHKVVQESMPDEEAANMSTQEILERGQQSLQERIAEREAARSQMAEEVRQAEAAAQQPETPTLQPTPAEPPPAEPPF